ncbi:MAG: dihydroorotase [Thiotrichales bacterium SG8_50]|nr:MAG: dihydroorotase [Thiotrichales bacterium SG8_50]
MPHVETLTITRPDDWHLHVRDGAALKDIVPPTAHRFARAIIMPNLRPPVTTTAQALSYRERILEATPRGVAFEPLMTLYLTDITSAAEISNARDSGRVVAVKLYPAGATTNSESGVTDIARTYPALEAMQQAGLPLLVHGEVTDPGVDVFDRESRFIDQHLLPLVNRFPALKVVLEHITTADAVDFVAQSGANVAATITPHHLLYNRNVMLAGGIRPHYYCLPVLKRETHRRRLVEAAISGNAKFFLGTDSAPHARGAKESNCGCAGIYSAHAAIELYAEVFDDAGALDKLEAFASWYGPDFYGLARNREHITLVKEAWTVPDQLPFGEQTLVPLRAGEQVRWKLVD